MAYVKEVDTRSKKKKEKAITENKVKTEAVNKHRQAERKANRKAMNKRK